MFAPVGNSPTPEGDTILRGPTPTARTPPSETVPDGRPAPPPGAMPSAIPGYEILGELGRGTMGVVYRARNIRLNRLVALKVVLDGAQSRPEDLVRFLAEAEVLARCQHPHVVLIYDAGWYDGRPYLAMELVEGGTLSRKHTGGPQAPRRAAELAEMLARGVGHAHTRGIVHRDLKPSNVLLTPDGLPKLTDFGLAKRLDGDDGLTQTGTLLGTPGYMAPEQALCREVGPSADVYALGAILYELLTGEPPFRAESLLQTLELVVSEPPRRPRLLRPQVPRDLEAVCLKCLQKEPRDRYASADEVAEDLRRFLAGRPVRARRPWPWRRALAWVRRHPGLSGCCIGAALGATTSLLWAAATVSTVAFIFAVAALGYAAWSLVRVEELERERDAALAACKK